MQKNFKDHQRTLHSLLRSVQNLMEYVPGTLFDKIIANKIDENIFPAESFVRRIFFCRNFALKNIDKTSAEKTAEISS